MCVCFRFHIWGQVQPVFQLVDQGVDPDIRGCSEISGEYHSLGKSSSSLSPYYERPILERNSFGIEKEASDTNSVQLIITKEPLALDIYLKDKIGNTILNRQYDDKLSCDGRWLVGTSEIKGGSGESSHVSTKTTWKYSRSVNKELIIYVCYETISKSWIFFKKKEFHEIWYLYAMKK